VIVSLDGSEVNDGLDGLDRAFNRSKANHDPEKTPPCVTECGMNLLGVLLSCEDSLSCLHKHIVVSLVRQNRGIGVVKIALNRHCIVVLRLKCPDLSLNFVLLCKKLHILANKTLLGILAQVNTCHYSLYRRKYEDISS